MRDRINQLSCILYASRFRTVNVKLNHKTYFEGEKEETSKTKQRAATAWAHPRALMLFLNFFSAPFSFIFFFCSYIQSSL